MAVISIKELLEAGVHFGHQTKRWNPKMKKFIYEARNGIYIIDLQKTVRCIEDAYKMMLQVVGSGGKVLFVGTKKQAKDSIFEAAQKTGMFYVTERWLGGMLTNLKTIRMSVSKLKDMEKLEESGDINLLSKKESASIRREMLKLRKNLDGVKSMDRLPDLLFVVDPKKEHLAVAEARRLHIPIIGMIDTNSDPDEVDLAIPANDDSIRSIQVIVGKLVDAVREGKGQLVKEVVEEKKEDEEDVPPELAPVSESDDDRPKKRVRSVKKD